MNDNFFGYFITQGPFAALFVWLLFYVMKTSRERESRLQDLLEKFSSKYDLIVEKIDKLEELFRK